MIDGPALTDLISRGKVRVPPAPASAVRIQKVLAEPNHSPDQVVEIVSLDPSLSAAVLRLGNIGDWKRLAPVSTVPEAIERIGGETVLRMALAIPAGDAATHDGPLAQLRLLAWRRSVLSAMICRCVALERGGPPADAFTCGLLHDFGWIVALSALEDLLAEHPDEQQRSAASWLELVDQFHILLGHVTAVRWSLPPMIAEAMLCHHLPEKAASEYRPVIELVALSDQVVALLEEHPSVSAEQLARLPGVTEPFASQLAEALPKIAAETSQLLELFPAAETSTPSKVARSTGTLRGKVKPVQWPVAWMNRQGAIPGVITAVTFDGLAAVLPEAPRENFVIKLAVSVAGRSFEIFATPVTIEQMAGQHRVEARLFALGGEPKKAWDQLYTTTV